MALGNHESTLVLHRGSSDVLLLGESISPSRLIRGSRSIIQIIQEAQSWLIITVEKTIVILM
jgi:hypothetical protein